MSERETGQVWRWIFRKSMLDEHKIRFISGISNEDTVFNADCLLMANSLKSLHKPLYVYEPRPEGLMNTNNQIERMIKNKYDFLNQRKRLGEIYGKLTGKNPISLYGGNLVMSALQLGLVLDGNNAFQQYSDYVKIAEVREAIKMAKPHYGNWKVSIPILLLKAKLTRTLFYIFQLSKKFGLKIKF